MKIGGVSIILILGFLNMILILFQLSTGLRWIKVPFGIHRRTGMILFISAALHAFLPTLQIMGEERKGKAVREGIGAAAQSVTVISDAGEHLVNSPMN